MSDDATPDHGGPDGHHPDPFDLHDGPPSWVQSDRWVPTRFVQPAQRLLKLEASGGIVMLVAAVLAIVVANSALGPAYQAMFDTVVGVTVEAPAAAGHGAAEGEPYPANTSGVVEHPSVGDHGDGEAFDDVSFVESQTLDPDTGEMSGAKPMPMPDGTIVGTRDTELDDHDDPTPAAAVDHGRTLHIGPFVLHHLPNLTLRLWINDGLMALFFLLVGLEIKRELVAGELKDRRKAALPAMAALGGMVVPALVFLAFNHGGAFASGWGVPMATDIAFAVGVVALLGSRVPTPAKLFLLTLAIVDDLGAIAVIATVYTPKVGFGWLLGAVALLICVHLLHRAGVRSPAPFVVLGVLAWVAMLESGVHATIAGVAMALLTPVAATLSPAKYASRVRPLVDRAEAVMGDDDLHTADHHTLEHASHLTAEVRRLSRDSMPKLTRLELALAPWVAFGIVPLFAFANAGVALSGDDLAASVSDPVTLGVAAGLVVGKVVGVLAFTWLALRFKLGVMPDGVTWRHLIGLSFLAGIGFTVALFVAGLAFTDPAAVTAAKVGIFAASGVAGIVGYLWLRACPTAD